MYQQIFPSIVQEDQQEETKLNFESESSREHGELAVADLKKMVNRQTGICVNGGAEICQKFKLMMLRNI